MAVLRNDIILENANKLLNDCNILQAASLEILC
jgi:hypothetical protein